MAGVMDLAGGGASAVSNPSSFRYFYNYETIEMTASSPDYRLAGTRA